MRIGLFKRFIICEEANDGDAPSGGGTSGGAVAPEVNYEKLAAAIVAAQEKKTDDSDDKGVFEQTKELQRKEQVRAQELDQMRSIVEFDRSFDSVLIDNAPLFTMTPKSIRDGAANLKDAELVKMLQCVSAKDFFSNSENIALLDEADQKYINLNIIKLPESYMDAPKAWSLVDKAILINKRISQHTSISNKNNNPFGVDAPNVTNYLKKCAGEEG